MNPLLDTMLHQGLLLDAAGVLGLGLLACAAVRLTRQGQIAGGGLLLAGALSLLMARIYLLLAPHLVSNEVLLAIGPFGVMLTLMLPPLMLCCGLAGVVGGLWQHQRLTRRS